MSDIDTIRHYRAGLFAGVPIYIAREDGERTFEDLAMLRNNVAIGGGSGEHPAMLITNPVACVAHYLDPENWLEPVHDILEINDYLKIELPSIFHYCNEMSRDQWIEQLADYHSPLKDGKSFEKWVAETLGEFLYNFVRGIYPDSDAWFSEIGRLDDDGGDVVSLPWGEYGGSGIDLFLISQKPTPKNDG